MPSKGYHNDQFFNLKGESTPYRAGNGYKALTPDNPPFTYPSRVIRTDDHTGRKNIELKRGYIRTLASNAEASAMGIRKCQFQFNPTTLQQSVSMATGMLNVMQQDPAQFAQPMATSQNFSFTLMFDRSMEINNDNGKVVTGSDAVDVWRQNSPGQVGVLRDLQALYNTIGQGYSTQQRDYVAKLLADTLKTEASSITAPEDAADQLTAATQKLNSGSFVDINIGNSAFLIPFPVRVVFSSLYVVEGLVSNTSVVFTKFSTTMVPMQCMVTVTMEAKFIGFSKQKTFFTEVLAQRDQMEADLKAAEAAELASLTDAFSKMMSRIHVKTVLYTGPNVTNTNPSLSQLLTNIPAFPTSALTYIPYPAADTSESNDPVSRLIDNNTEVQVQVNSQFFVYGPFTTFNVGSNPSQSAIIAKVKSLGSPEVYSSMISSSDGYQTTASDKRTWRAMSDGGSSYPHFSKATAVYDTSKYYVIQSSADVRVVSGSHTLAANGTSYAVVNPGTGTTRKAAQSVLLKWPKSSSGAAPASNTATNPPKPGSTGNGRVPGVK